MSPPAGGEGDCRDYPLPIVQRGINREACFFAEEDYHRHLHSGKQGRIEGQQRLEEQAMRK
ncbi:MAG TPA: hypothetical protein PLS67_11315 [Accumulibacter sp.]|jgi:hypothetical protein|nr:hypothetical protein [Accumulibacter sp.]HQC81085.1 hypothetical protein [Accumulibacter sp.]